MARADAFVRTCQQIVVAALRKIGAVDESGLATPKQLENGMEDLNIMVSHLGEDGTKLWLISSATKTCVVGAATVVMNANVMDINHLVLRISGDDQPVTLVDRTEWIDIPTKADAGQPTKAYLDRGDDPPTLYLHPVPNQAFVMYFDETRRVWKFDKNSDNSDFPPHWTKALVDGLAATIAPGYRKSIIERRDLRGEARDSLREARRLDRGTSDTRFVSRAY
jgi:hypothetical protein